MMKRVLPPSNLEFDHCYTTDRDHEFLGRLAKAGFTLDPSIVEHPGRHVCRFILFSPPQLKTRQYLEFISKPVRQGNKPGLSFRCADRLEDRFKAIRRDRFLKPTFEHRNYSWKTTGKKVRELGWNFIHFRRKISAAEVWLTEYERAGRKKTRLKSRPRHANGAISIIGLIFEVTASGRLYFESILRRKVEGALRLPCGTELILEHARTTRFRGVLIKSANFRRFCSLAKPDEIALIGSRMTATLKNPSGAWDIRVV